MSWDVCTVTNPVSRKDYSCDACRVISGFGWDTEDFTMVELAVFQKAKYEGYKILKGTKYIKCHGIWEGRPGTFRAREDIDVICHRHGLYED